MDTPPVHVYQPSRYPLYISHYLPSSRPIEETRCLLDIIMGGSLRLFLSTVEWEFRWVITGSIFSNG